MNRQFRKKKKDIKRTNKKMFNFTSKCGNANSSYTKILSHTLHIGKNKKSDNTLK